ncbi:MAG: ATP-binding protein [Acidobacteria bacterium]|nr:ATP-binding protein [Acidobacteriota bacterium]
MVVGAVLSLFLLHPVTMVIYWFEMHPVVPGVDSALGFALHRLFAAFRPAMWPMTLAFLVLGMVLGLGSAAYSRAVGRWSRRASWLEAELHRDLESLLRAGEGELLELKSSARWDFSRGSGNKHLELAIVRTVAGFLNGAGGTLLIGVDDDGAVVGLEKDYHTLRSKDRDGFEQFLVGLVSQKLGSDACAMVHVVFHEVEGRDVCRVVVEPSPVPVFLAEGDRSHYYLRVGNVTRELDAEEALRHATRVRDRSPGSSRKETQ